MNYIGVIIEESLVDSTIFKDLTIIETKVEEVTEEHKTPWVKQWTLHTVEIPEDQAEKVAHKISHSLDTSYGQWYADFKNDKFHYIIFKDKVFKVDRSRPDEYQEVTDYGISLGVPDYQIDFSSVIKAWERFQK